MSLKSSEERRDSVGKEREREREREKEGSK